MNAARFSPQHESNIRRLCAYLLSGHLKADFTMAVFSSNVVRHETSQLDCGSAGCFLGHAPHAGILKNPGETWTEFGYREFGLAADGPGHWSWCCGVHWSVIDNSPSGAAKRALWLLEKGLPETWHKQMRGTEPLCYTVLQIEPAMLDWQSLVTEAPDAVA